MPALIVSIDGPDFCGKTTIANIVVELLRTSNTNLKINRTGLPTDFVTGSFTDILRGSKENIPPEVLSLVYAADHLFHYFNSIKPLKESKENHVIIQERSLLTTYIYQGLLGKVDFSWIDEINKYDKNIPNLTLILKLNLEELKRRKSLDRRLFDRFEGLDFIKRQAEVYYNLPQELIEKFSVEYVDANTEPINVAKKCVSRIEVEIKKFFG